MSLPRLLALDAGGTSTRAVVVDAAGRAYGYGFASGGNPTAAGIREAAAAIGIAAEQALASFDQLRPTGLGPDCDGRRED